MEVDMLIIMRKIAIAAICFALIGSLLVAKRNDLSPMLNALFEATKALIYGFLTFTIWCNSVKIGLEYNTNGILILFTFTVSVLESAKSCLNFVDAISSVNFKKAG